MSALSTASGWRMIIDLFLLAACGGVFSVPLYAIIQDRAAPTERARMVAANNIMNALFMVAGAAATAGAAAIGWHAPRFLHAAAAANLVVALWIMRVVRSRATAAPSVEHRPAGSSRR
jgi:MFS family permease